MSDHTPANPTILDVATALALLPGALARIENLLIAVLEKGSTAVSPDVPPAAPTTSTPVAPLAEAPAVKPAKPAKAKAPKADPVPAKAPEDPAPAQGTPEAAPPSQQASSPTPDAPPSPAQVIALRQEVLAKLIQGGPKWAAPKAKAWISEKTGAPDLNAACATAEGYKTLVDALANFNEAPADEI